MKVSLPDNRDVGEAVGDSNEGMKEARDRYDARQKMIADKSTALKVMIAAQKKSAADYRASKPALAATRDAANKAALDSKNTAIAKANATYGTFIESIGYGVLIP